MDTPFPPPLSLRAETIAYALIGHAKVLDEKEAGLAAGAALYVSHDIIKSREAVCEALRTLWHATKTAPLLPPAPPIAFSTSFALSPIATTIGFIDAMLLTPNQLRALAVSYRAWAPTLNPMPEPSDAPA